MIPVQSYDAVVVGSGCAGYSAAHWLYQCARAKGTAFSAAIVTEGRLMGTSRNTGSDKQTYYKLTIAGDGDDSAFSMAQTLFSGGGMNGDTALAEAAGSVRGFLRLSLMGVPFPSDAYGQFVGYKTDHDPRQRATSAGPLTSKYMTEALEDEVMHCGIPILDGFQALRILTSGGRVCGLLCMDTAKAAGPDRGLRFLRTPHVILATGGPAGIYADSVYPESQTGGTGLALEAGAACTNLSQWQYGLASVDFRWNVSGTYQQVLPRFYSVDGGGTEREFLADALGERRALDLTFLKGYQWPFDTRKIGGSSQVDMLVYRETQAGRRVYMDFRSNPRGLGTDTPDITVLGEEARNYLKRSGAYQPRPVDRLAHMNPKAIDLYASHGIDLYTQPLRVAVCAQHHNGGISVDADWQTTVPGLYAAGEAAGTLGVYRPGGTALNSTQVGSMRAAEAVVYSPAAPVSDSEWNDAAASVQPFTESLLAVSFGKSSVRESRLCRAQAMSACAAHIRDIPQMSALRARLLGELAHFTAADTAASPSELPQLLKNRDLLITAIAVLDACIAAAAEKGSHGAALVRDPEASDVFLPEKTGPNCECITRFSAGSFSSAYRPVRPIPRPDDWFENVWREYDIRTGRR